MKKWILIALTAWYGCLENVASVWADPVLEAGLTTYSQAKQLMEKRKWAEAATLLQELLKEDPKSNQILSDLAVALAYSGSRSEGLKILVQAAQSAKGPDRIFLTRRIKVLSRLFLTNKTFQVYQDAVNLLMNKKYGSANERFERALADEPDNVEILTRFGQSLILNNEFDAAVKKLKLASRLNPFQFEIRLWLGRGFAQLNKPNEAITELTLANNELRGSEWAAVWLADALVATGQANAALHVLETDVKQWPFHILSLMNSARFRLQVPRPDTKLLWAARKELQLAMSRLEQYVNLTSTHSIGDFEIDINKPAAEIKAEIQRLQQQVDNRLSQVSNHR